jgi:hypothetical protein
MPQVAARAVPSEAAVVTKAALRAAALLGIPQKSLSRIVGLSEASVSRMAAGTFTLAAGDKPFELAVLFIRFYRALDALAQGETEVARGWLRAPNAALGGTPLALIETLPGLVNAVAYLDARRARL